MPASRACNGNPDNRLTCTSDPTPCYLFQMSPSEYAVSIIPSQWTFESSRFYHLSLQPRNLTVVRGSRHCNLAKPHGVPRKLNRPAGSDLNPGQTLEPLTTATTHADPVSRDLNSPVPR